MRHLRVYYYFFFSIFFCRSIHRCCLACYFPHWRYNSILQSMAHAPPCRIQFRWLNFALLFFAEAFTFSLSLSLLTVIRARMAEWKRERDTLFSPEWCYCRMRFFILRSFLLLFFVCHAQPRMLLHCHVPSTATPTSCEDSNRSCHLWYAYGAEWCHCPGITSNDRSRVVFVAIAFPNKMWLSFTTSETHTNNVPTIIITVIVTCTCVWPSRNELIFIIGVFICVNWWDGSYLTGWV